MIITKQVNDPMGIHGRQSTKIATLLEAYTFTLNGHPVRDTLDILALGIAQGETMTFDIDCSAGMNRSLTMFRLLEF